MILKAMQRATGIPIHMTSAMRTALELWRDMYTSSPPLNAPWGIEDQVLPTNIPASIAEELAGLTLTEYNAEVTGGEAATYINEEFQRETAGLDRKVELCCAYGGIVIRPYVSPDAGGKSTHIEVDFTDALHFYPTDFNSKGEIAGGLFVSHRRRGDRIYTRIEYQVLEGDIYTIRNMAFRSQNMIAGVETVSDETLLSERVPLTEIPEWAGITEEFTIHGLKEPLFAYVRMPKGNKVDIDSPLGESAFAGAINIIHEANVQLELTSWEYRSKENKILASTEMFRRKKRKEKSSEGDEVFLPGLSRLFRLFPGEKKEQEKVLESFSPGIRDENFWNGYNKYLRRIEYNCGLAYGMLSDPEAVTRTAEEMKQSRQRAFRTVSRIQEEWKEGLNHLVRSMAVLAKLYHLCPDGDVELTCTFGDSILEDTDKEFSRRMSMAAADMIRPTAVTAWYFGCTEEEAKKMLPEEYIEDETPTTEE